MTKQELLRLMRLLSALETLCFLDKKEIPPQWRGTLCDCVEVLEREILK